MTSTRIDPQLASRLETDASHEFDLLIRVSRVDETVEHDFVVLGITIRRRLTLIPTYAVTCPGPTALELLNYPWVICIEEDRIVYAH